jgi:hypothetical protein
MVFISKRLDATTAEYRNWYIQHHAPDFLSFARPYLVRYTQDFVDKARMGAADFDCITEFRYRSREALAELMRVLDTPEAKATLASHPRPGSKPGPHEDHGGSRTFSTDERLLAGPARVYDRPGTRKQAVLLRRKGTASPAGFADAAAKFGSTIAAGPTARVALDLAVPEVGRPTPLYDAVIQIWPRKGADPAASLGAPPDGIEIADIVDLLSYESQLGAA